MNRRDEGFTHMEYRNAKIMHLVEKDQTERFIYKKAEISKEEANEITAQYLEEREKKRIKKEALL